MSFKKRTSKMSGTKQIKANKIAIKKLKHAPEIKYLEAHNSLENPTSGVMQVLLNGMIRGDEWGERIGQSVQDKFLELNVYLSQESSVSSNRCRIMVLQDVMPQGINLNPNRLFSDLTSDITKIMTLRDKSLKEDFRVRYDRVHILSGNDNQNNERLLKIRVPLRTKTLYNSTDTNTFSSIEKNALWMVAVFSNTNWSWYYNYIFHYTDS